MGAKQRGGDAATSSLRCAPHLSGGRPRLAALAAKLFEQQAAAPAMPVDPELEALLPF